jgi:hypothetical protein
MRALKYIFSFLHCIALLELLELGGYSVDLILIVALSGTPFVIEILLCAGVRLIVHGLATLHKV